MKCDEIFAESRIKIKYSKALVDIFSNKPHYANDGKSQVKLGIDLLEINISYNSKFFFAV